MRARRTKFLRQREFFDDSYNRLRCWKSLFADLLVQKYIDGLSIDDTESVVRDRKHLAEDGLIVAVCCVSEDSGEILQEPDIINRGSILTDEQVQEVKNIVMRVISSFDVKSSDLGDIRNTIRKQLRNYILKKTKKSPMIIPVITEV